MTRERAIKELEYEYNHLAEEYEFTETCVETQAFKMAIKALEIIGDLEKALPKICTTQFEAYVYHKVLELDEVTE